jgi:hypothetical protein
LGLSGSPVTDGRPLKSCERVSIFPFSNMEKRSDVCVCVRYTHRHYILLLL